MTEAVAVNKERRIVLLSNDEIVPITDYVTEDGEMTDDPELAFVAVAGPTIAGKWLAIQLENFKVLLAN